MIHVVNGSPKVNEIKDLSLGEVSLSSLADDLTKIERGVLDEKTIEALPHDLFVQLDRESLGQSIGSPYFLFISHSAAFADSLLDLMSQKRRADLVLEDGQTAVDTYCIPALGCKE